MTANRVLVISLLISITIAVSGCRQPEPQPVAVPFTFEDGSETQYVWEPIAPLPEPRFEAGTTVVDGKMYVFGGFTTHLKALSSIVTYDPQTDAWSVVGHMLTSTTHMNVVRDGRRLWYAGGFAGDNPGVATTEVWCYDIDAQTFTAGTPLPEARGAGAMALIGRELHYVGGLQADRQTDCMDHWALNVDTGTEWVALAPLPEAKNHHSAAAIDGRLYVFGGEHGHDQVHWEGPWEDVATMHLYDPNTDTWTRLGDLPTPLSHVEPSTVLLNDRIVVAGGRTGHYDVAEVWAYSPETDGWEELPRLPTPMRGASVAVIDGWVYVAGGRFYRDAVIDAAWKGRAVFGWVADKSAGTTFP